MSALAATLRWVHLAAGLGLVGLFTVLLLAGRSDRPTALRWQARVLAAGRALAVLAPMAAVAVLAAQAALVTGRTGALLEPAQWLGVLASTRFGSVWMVHLGMLLLLSALVLLREAGRERSVADWVAFRVQAGLLATAALVPLAWAGHAAAVEPGATAAALVVALHLLGAGVWLGALPPLALLLLAAAGAAGADARPYAVLAARRFSRLALSAMLVLVATGLVNAWNQVGDVPSLVGTPYGRLLLTKVALLVAVLLLATASRRRLLPRLGGEGATVGRPAMARLARHGAGEALLGLGMVAVAAVLATTPPARHGPIWWPFDFRLDWAAASAPPGPSTRALVGSQIAVLGVLAAVGAIVAARRRALLLAAGTGAVVLGLSIALPPLAVNAYPTTYRRPAVAYHAVSVARGMALYREHCASCHGRGGAGDGPAASSLPRPPADLTARHTGDHTAGDLFWWLTHGIPRGGMPGFGDRLSDEERWDLVNLVRALSGVEQARRLGPAVALDRPRLAAPDFAFSVGPVSGQTLRDYRGRRTVLLVLFTLPGSRERLARLAEAYETLQALGVEIVAVPVGDPAGVIGRLGADPPVLYPVVTGGAEEIVTSYLLFGPARAPDSRSPDPSPPGHVEFLIDRSGYLRGRWIPGDADAGWSDPRRLAAEVQALDRAAPSLPPAEHVH